MFLLIGLGNPGKEYENTRHNAGFIAIDEIADKYNFLPAKIKFHGEFKEGNISGCKVILLKPMTYMNKSGLSVGELVKFYKIPLENIIVIHDEIDLNVGKVRVKTGGGAGGHNGIKDIDAKIGKDYKRIRIGVGHPGDKDKVSGYVLNRFSKEDQPIIEKTIEDVAKNIEIILKGDDSLFMTKMA